MGAFCAEASMIIHSLATRQHAVPYNGYRVTLTNVYVMGYSLNYTLMG